MQQTDVVADVLQLTQVVRGDDGRQTSVRYILGKQISWDTGFEAVKWSE